MNTIFFGLLAVLSLFIFMNLGKLKASKKQMNRDDRIKWGRNRGSRFSQNRDGSKIIEGEAEEVKDESKK
ncbi:MAG: hypothetical protein CMD68_01790 [Gammaproteobacteria bacterium]|nr:hypothetical protein [Gammaproteobacteria bacterium]